MEPAQRVCNLSELAFVTGVSATTLSKWAREQSDFPVAERGSNGRAYQFDAAAVQAWIDNHKAEADAEAEARQAQLALWRADMYGDDPNPEHRPLTASERKAEAEAALAEDKVRRLRGELVELAPLEVCLTQALVELRNALSQVAAEVAREHGLPRETRIAMQNAVEHRMNAFADQIGDPATFFQLESPSRAA